MTWRPAPLPPVVSVSLGTGRPLGAAGSAQAAAAPGRPSCREPSGRSREGQGRAHEGSRHADEGWRAEIHGWPLEREHLHARVDGDGHAGHGGDLPLAATSTAAATPVRVQERVEYGRLASSSGGLEISTPIEMLASGPTPFNTFTKEC